MADLIFYLFAALILGSALLVVFNTNTVNAALWFLVGLVGVAGIFVLLDAYLLAVLLILVYAGAVVSLFLFIVMLLDSTGGVRKPFKKLTIGASVIAAALLIVGVCSFVQHGQFAAVSASPEFHSTLRDYGEKLFTTYLLPVQIVGFLLLIAMLGVIVLSKRFEGLEDIK
jgi:NADH-quinone oxidoreductase subunit J